VRQTSPLAPIIGLPCGVSGESSALAGPPSKDPAAERPSSGAAPEEGSGSAAPVVSAEGSPSSGSDGASGRVSGRSAGGGVSDDSSSPLPPAGGTGAPVTSAVAVVGALPSAVASVLPVGLEVASAADAVASERGRGGAGTTKQVAGGGGLWQLDGLAGPPQVISVGPPGE